MPRRTWESLSDLTREDLIDTRDLDDWLDELRDEVSDLRRRDDERDPRAGGLSDEERTELEAKQEIVDVLEEIESEVSEWRHGETLINENYFTDYARQLADDLGAIPSDAKWPLTCIDWEQATDELRRDYTSIEIDGTTFYFRA